MLRNAWFHHGQHLSLERADAELELCQFIDVHIPLGNGGAISATVPVQLFNCYFTKCWGQNGGGVSTIRSLSLQFVTFTSCGAAGNGGAVDMRSQERDDLDVNLCLFLGNHAEYFGSFYRITKGQMRLSSSNVTLSVANQCVGAAEVKSGSMHMRYTILADSTAKSHNGGLCARMLDSMTITLCLFARCRHTSTEKNAASALLGYDNPYDSNMTDCHFVANEPDRSFTLVVATGHALVVRGCLFSGPAAELGPHNLITEKCLFVQKEFAPISFRFLAAWRVPGYNPRISFVQRTVLPQTTSPDKVRKVRYRSATLVGLSLVVSAAIAAALTLLASLAHRAFNAALKIPRAIQ
jgi:hypothetical protein